MRIKITSDSTCDLPPDLIAQHDIGILPLRVVMDGHGYQDGVDMTAEDIFAHVRGGGALCSTTAVNFEEYRARFEPLSRQYDAVVHVNIGADFSSCYQNACLAAQEFDNVYVIDSRNICVGQGAIVLEACRLARDCQDVDALCAALRAMTEKVEVSVVLERLDYVVKGGRCSALVGLGANLLKLRVCLDVIGGKLKITRKYRGKQGKCLETYVQERLEGREDIVRDTLYLCYSAIEAEALAAARAAAQRFGGFKKIIDVMVGCVLSCHCGPGTLGMMYLRK